MRALLALAVLALAGCTGASHAVPEEYRPLKQITESPLRSGKYVTTIGETVYVNDLDDWLERRPVGSPLYRATLRHEQVHSKRQLKAGLTIWINQYLTDTEFMWKEEQLGWYEGLRSLQSSGLTINKDEVADALAGYKNLKGQMVTREVALAWVNDVVAGRWRPAN